jgi:hypothetical protein
MIDNAEPKIYSHSCTWNPVYRIQEVNYVLN